MAVTQRSASDPILGNGALVPGKLALAVEVLGIYVRVRWLVLRRGAVPAVSALRDGAEAQAVDDPDGTRVIRGRRFGRAVMRVLRLVPADSNCLMRSLVLTRLLARRGVYAKVVIGVRPEPNFAAHAWVEVDGQPMLPTGASNYDRLVEI